MRTSNEDAREFIRRSVLDLWTSPFPAYAPRISLKAQQRRERRERHTTLDPSAEVIDASSTLPITPLPSSPPTPRRLVNHFVMNLPNTAIEFLDAFRGLYIPLRQLEGASEAIDAAGEDNLPMVHCYCFTRAIDGAEQDLCEVRWTTLLFSYFPLSLATAPIDWKLNITRVYYREHRGLLEYK